MSHILYEESYKPPCYVTFFMPFYSEYRVQITNDELFFGFSWGCTQKRVDRSLVENVQYAQIGWKDSGWKRDQDKKISGLYGGGDEDEEGWDDDDGDDDDDNDDEDGGGLYKRTLTFQLGVVNLNTDLMRRTSYTMYAAKKGPALKITYKDGKWTKKYVFNCDDPVTVKKILLHQMTSHQARSANNTAAAMQNNNNNSMSTSSVPPSLQRQGLYSRSSSPGIDNSSSSSSSSSSGYQTDGDESSTSKDTEDCFDELRAEDHGEATNPNAFVSSRNSLPAPSSSQREGLHRRSCSPGMDSNSSSKRFQTDESSTSENTQDCFDELRAEGYGKATNPNTTFDSSVASFTDKESETVPMSERHQGGRLLFVEKQISQPKEEEDLTLPSGGLSSNDKHTPDVESQFGASMSLTTKNKKKTKRQTIVSHNSGDLDDLTDWTYDAVDELGSNPASSPRRSHGTKARNATITIDNVDIDNLVDLTLDAANEIQLNTTKPRQRKFDPKSNMSGENSPS